jgi:hypothetical protein
VQENKITFFGIRIPTIRDSQIIEFRPFIGMKMLRKCHKLKMKHFIEVAIKNWIRILYNYLPEFERIRAMIVRYHL